MTEPVEGSTTPASPTDPATAVTEPLAEHLRAVHRWLRETVGELDAARLDATLGPETNSIAVLVAHAIDTERSILHSVVDDPLPRDREAAFRTAGLGSRDVVALIDAWEAELDGLLGRVTGAHLTRPVVRWRTAPGAWWLMQMLGHTREHAGQAALTRQLLERDEGR